MRRTSTALALALAALLAAACGSGGAETKRPNVVLVLIDTLRPDHLDAFGYERSTAPFLSDLARRSVLFRSAFSASTWTAPSTASMFTGLYPNQHGITEGFNLYRQQVAEAQPQARPTVTLNRLSASVRTLPEHFERAGWATFGVACNVNITSPIGFDRGFQHFRDLTGPSYGKGGRAELALQQVREWRAQLDAAHPYFLYLHLNDVHAPWEGPDGRPLEGVAGYDAEIRSVDDVLRRAYEEFGWSRDTLFCVVSDHGEEFGEHGAFGHNFSVYRELMQIVMLVAWPERFPQARQVEECVGIVDVFPTLCELAGAPAPPGIEGRSAVACIEGAPGREERVLFAHRRARVSEAELWAVVRGEWKLVVRNRRRELYHRPSDGAERADVSAQYPEVVAQLERELARFRGRAQLVGGSSVDVPLDAQQVEALRALGYADEHK